MSSISLVVTLMATVDFMPMTARLMDHRPSWVRMPERMAGMPQKVWSRPVTSPAAMPAPTAASIASHRLVPVVKSMTKTAAPVQKEPSTVRSAMSRTL